MIFEAMAGFLILLFVPFMGISLLHSGAPTSSLLGGFLVLCIVFVLGLLLFRDAVVLRIRLKKEATL
jgi:hypothetical protein